MSNQWTCVEDECSNVVADERVRLKKLPVEGTGRWVTTGEEDDELGLEITEWTGERELVNVAICAECYEREQALIAQLETMNHP